MPMTRRATTSRRKFLQTGLAASAAAAAPGRLTAQPAPPAPKTSRAVMHGDLTVLDPIWTTANMSAYHGAMLYDTLFGIDANLDTKPQMVTKWGASDDQKTWTFELRDGLKFTDGSPVTADDVIASLRRWAARDGAGQHMMQRVSDIAKKDDKTFQFILKEPYGYLVDALGKTSTPLCYVMRKKEAETNPMEKITAYVGSGPFIFNETETRQGVRYVYDRNPNYVPRAEPASGLARNPPRSTARARGGAIGQGTALRRGGGRQRHPGPQDSLPPYSAGHRATAHRAGDLRGGLRHPYRGGPVVLGRRHTAGNSNLGQHDRLEPRLLGARSLDHLRPGSRLGAGGVGGEPCR